MGSRERTEVPQNAGNVMIGAEEQRKERRGERGEFRKGKARGSGRHGKGGRRSELRGKGRREGEEKGLKRESGGVCTKKVLACMVAGYASKKVGALIEFPRSVTPGTGG